MKFNATGMGEIENLIKLLKNTLNSANSKLTNIEIPEDFEGLPLIRNSINQISDLLTNMKAIDEIINSIIQRFKLSEDNNKSIINNLSDQLKGLHNIIITNMAIDQHRRIINSMNRLKIPFNMIRPRTYQPGKNRLSITNFYNKGFIFDNNSVTGLQFGVCKDLETQKR